MKMNVGTWRVAGIGFFVLLALASVGAAPTQAQDAAHGAHHDEMATDAPDADAISATVARFHTALGAGDADVVRAMLVPEARIVEGGNIENVEEYASHHLPADMAFAAAVERERGPLEIFQVDDVAWVASTSRSTGTYRDRDIDSQGAELMVLRRIEGVWRVAAVHWSSRSRS